MKLFEIFDQFISGTPIQRKDSWGKDVFIKATDTKIKLCRKTSNGETSVIQSYTWFDRYFNLDDLKADDWVEVK